MGSPVEIKPLEGSIIKDEYKTVVWRQTLPDGTPAVMKLYRHRIPSFLERRGLYTTRARREFLALCHLEDHGVACSAPLFWAGGESPDTERYELLATREVKDSVDLVNWLRNPAGREPIDWAPLFALAAKLHQSGLQHGALQSRNILLAEGQFYLIDLPRSRWFGRSIEGWGPGLFDLKVLIQSLARYLSEDQLIAGLAGYHRLPVAAEELVRSVRAKRLSNPQRNTLHAVYVVQGWAMRLFSK